MRKTSRCLFLLLSLFLCRSGQAAELTTSPDTSSTASRDAALFDRYEIDAETAMLWKVGGGATPLSYTFLPQLVTLKTPANMHWRLGDGDLIVRSRYSLLMEPIIRGPERYFVGVSASGCIEYWDQPRRLCLFFASGGGVGVMHSKGHEIAGGQGEDLNLNWLIYSGVRYRFKETMNASCGIYFQHISNGGMDRVNPGVNALGPMISLGWHF